MSDASDRYTSRTKTLKNTALGIANMAAEKISANHDKKGILLCEGKETSFDKVLYSAVYPELIVVPSNGCTDIIKLLPFVKKYSEYPSFGIIDRDNCSKRLIRKREREDEIYSTKLPFIENVICCPEVLKILCKIYEKNYSEVLREVRTALAEILADKMNLLNPFNIELPKDEVVQSVSIKIVTKSRTVVKNIDLSNIMYTFRDKAIVGKVADAMGFRSREVYYKALKTQMDSKNGYALIFAMAKYLPDIKYFE